MQTLVIAERFCGPPNSGNGGYTCGMMAQLFEGPAEVTLRNPPPLNKEMQIQYEGVSARLMDGDLLIAEARPAELDMQMPPAISLQQAREAAEHFSGFEHHVFPGCFVCGTERAEGDGLRIFTGPAGDRVAAPWRPEQSLADDTGQVRPEFVWAALDCPGYFAAFNGKPSQKALLGRMTAELREPIAVGEECVVIGWPEQAGGRKHGVGTAIFKQNGSLAALARGLWITIE